MDDEPKNIPVFIVVILWILLIVLMLTGCTRTQYVPVKEVKIDSISVKDTVMLEKLIPYRDSVAIKDTVSFLTNPYAYSRAIWRHGTLHHTLAIWPNANVVVKMPYFINRYVYRSIPQIIEVEKKMTRWQRIKMSLGELSLFGLIICVVVIIFKMTKFIDKR